MPWRARTVRPLLLRRRASRPQLKRDPLGVNAQVNGWGGYLTKTLRLLALGAVVVLAFDTVGATASRLLGFRYSILTIGTYIIYGTACFRIGQRAGILQAVLGGAMLGLLDATLGWRISWAIGPSRLPGGAPSPAQLVNAILSVVVLGALLGLVGGAFGWTLRSRSVDA